MKWCCDTNTHTHILVHYIFMPLSWCRIFFLLLKVKKLENLNFFSSCSFSGEHFFLSVSLALPFFQLCSATNTCTMRGKSKSFTSIIGWLTHTMQLKSPPAPAYTVISFWFRIPTLYLLSLMFLTAKRLDSETK